MNNHDISNVELVVIVKRIAFKKIVIKHN